VEVPYLVGGTLANGINIVTSGGHFRAVVKYPVRDETIWLEYLETVAKEWKDWYDLYLACRELV